ncbi:Calcium uptake protein 1, mitochondrial [Sorochytrium milnesiophthora]
MLQRLQAKTAAVAHRSSALLHSRSAPRRLLGAVAAGGLLLFVCNSSISTAAAEEKRVEDSTSLEAWKRRKIGRYENRIRAYSHPRKVFHYFATVLKGDSVYMTPEDFVRSLIPYRDVPDSERPDERYRRLKTQSAIELFKLADTDGDGVISYPEYMLFLALLLIPQEHYRIAFRVFDFDNSGNLSHDEFVRFVDSQTGDSTAPFFERLGRQEHSRLSMADCHGLLELFFGRQAGDRTMSYDEFLGFMQRLRFELLKLEYYQYNVRMADDTISLKDFAYALISGTDYHHLGKYHGIIENMPSQSSERIGFAQFAQFDALIESIDDLTLALNICSRSEHNLALRHLVPPDDFRRAVKASSDIALTDGQMQVLTKLFGGESDGLIDYRQFMRAIVSRQQMGLDSRRDVGFARLMGKMWTCARKV